MVPKAPKEPSNGGHKGTEGSMGKGGRGILGCIVLGSTVGNRGIPPEGAYPASPPRPLPRPPRVPLNQFLPPKPTFNRNV